jgi:archaellum component FlaG (FlaF/FlaG flagellin family)
MKTKKILALFALAALALLLVALSDSATAKTKPNYHLKVTISGIPKKIVLQKHYTYTIKIKNTGRLKFKKLNMTYWNARFVTGASPKYNRKQTYIPGNGNTWAGWTNIANVKPGTTRTFKVHVTYTDPSAVIPYNSDQVRAYVVGVGTKEVVDITKQANY